MARKDIPKRFRKYYDQAFAQADLQFGAQGDLLAQLLGTAGDDYQRSVKQSRGGAALLKQGIDEARGTLMPNLAASGIDPAALAGTPDGRRVGQTVANTLNELDLRKAQAAEYAASGVRQAEDAYRQDAGQIRTQLQRLVKDRGTYTSSLLDELIEGDRNARREARAAARQQAFDAEQKALDRDTDLRQSIIGQNVDPDTGKLINPRKDRAKPGEKGGGPKWSEAEQRKASDTIEKALSYVRKADPGKGGAAERRAAIAKMLVEGIPGKTDPFTGEKSGGVPSLPAIYVSAALDLHFGKSLSRKTIRRLHDRGVKIKPLGYPTATRPRKYKPNAPGTTGTSTGPSGQQRPG